MLRCWGYIACRDRSEEPETWASFLLPTRFQYDLPPIAQDAFKTAAGRQRFVATLMSLPKDRYTEPMSRWERLREPLDIEDEDE